MKLVALCLLLATAAMADVNWYYQIEQIPPSIPQAQGIVDAGVMVFIRKPAAAGQVCVAYTLTSDNTSRTACTPFAPDSDVYPYIPTRLNLASDAADFHVTTISVTSGITSTTVTNPIPGVEY